MSLTGISANRLELLQIADAVAREKSIDREIVIEAIEEAIQKGARSRYGAEHDIRELRLALVCYGGVSLAIYMHGTPCSSRCTATAPCMYCDPLRASSVRDCCLCRCRSIPRARTNLPRHQRARKPWCNLLSKR